MLTHLSLRSLQFAVSLPLGLLERWQLALLDILGMLLLARDL